jgi:hypothetical protein
MTTRRSNANDRTAARRTVAGMDASTVPTSAVASPGDVSGKLALVLASFALAVASFLIILVAIAASNA